MSNKENIHYLLNRAEELLASIKLVYEMESRDHSQYSKVSAFSSHKTFAVQLNSLVLDILKEFPTASFFTYDTNSMKGAFNSVYGYRKDIMDGILIEVGKIRAFLQAKLGKEQEEINKIISLVRFQLRNIVRTPPKLEVEIQDKIEDLLIGAGYSKGTNFNRETGRVKTGVKESVPDFVFKTLDFCIEVKLVKDRTGPKRVTEEINADITSYGTEYGNIFFLIYDCGGNIQNIDEFKYNLTGLHVSVEVVKH